MENKHFITIWWTKINIQFSSNSEVKGSWLVHYINKRHLLLVTSEAHERRVCVGTPRPVPQLRKVTVVFVRVDCGGNMTWVQKGCLCGEKERKRETEKEKRRVFPHWDKICFYVFCKIQKIQLSNIRPHWTKSQHYNSKVNLLSLNTRLGILFIDPSCMK